MAHEIQSVFYKSCVGQIMSLHDRSWVSETLSVFDGSASVSEIVSSTGQSSITSSSSAAMSGLIIPRVLQLAVLEKRIKCPDSKRSTGSV